MSKPGMMLYWETFDTLDKARGENVKILLRAMRDYAQNGNVPDFGGNEALEMAWPGLKQKIDADSASYEKVVKQRTDAANSRWEKARAKAKVDV